MSLRPIVVICGATGVGKSKLVIDLALHVNRNPGKFGWRTAKVINADAMQVYKGLDIITNKVPESEQQGIPHLLMGFKQPHEQYVVGDFVQDAIKLIDEMHENKELPIIVGGTSYWIQHLVFPDRLVSTTTVNRTPSPDPQERKTCLPDLEKSVQSLPPELFDLFKNLPEKPPSAKTNPDQAFKLHTLLSLLDPSISERWHWKDTRKVLRNLEIVKDIGKRPSQIIHQQSIAAKQQKPRYRTLMFWLYADLTALRPRLDVRVDAMISQGLLDEVRWMRELANRKSSEGLPVDMSTSDYTLGIYQSIGYRELCGYLEDPSEKSYSEAVERMKISTRQYAKRQISWIRNKLIAAVDAANESEPIVPLYLLDATELGTSWETKVHVPAANILDAFLHGDDLPDPKSLSAAASSMLIAKKTVIDPRAILEARKKRVCSVCTVNPNRPIMIEEGKEWHIHKSTRSHQRHAAKKLLKTAVS